MQDENQPEKGLAPWLSSRTLQPQPVEKGIACILQHTGSRNTQLEL